MKLLIKKLYLLSLNNEYLVNKLVNHEYLCSGMPTSHYTSTYDAGIGCIKWTTTNNFLRELQKRLFSMRIRFKSSLRRDRHLLVFRWNQYCYICKAWMAQKREGYFCWRNRGRFVWCFNYAKVRHGALAKTINWYNIYILFTSLA